MTTSRIESRLDAIEKNQEIFREELIGFHKRQKKIQNAILELTGMVSASQLSHPKQQSATVLQGNIEMPSFDGDDLFKWLEIVEQYFATHSRVSEEEFGGGDTTASPGEQLASLRQTGSVDEYANEFRARVAQIDNLDQLLQGMFLNGLKEEIWVKFGPNDAEGPEIAIRTAKAIERELNFNNQAKGRREYSHQESLST
ncbi:unnamed protein product [Arabidopsis halleri]